MGLCLWIPHVYGWVLKETRRGLQISRSWSLWAAWCVCWELNLVLWKAASILSHWAISPAPTSWLLVLKVIDIHHKGKWNQIMRLQSSCLSFKMMDRPLLLSCSKPFGHFHLSLHMSLINSSWLIWSHFSPWHLEDFTNNPTTFIYSTSLSLTDMHAYTHAHGHACTCTHVHCAQTHTL